jgi:shikimate dehydrogenase
MATARDIKAIQNCLTNPLNCESVGNGRVAGVIGAAPSRYSKSPAIWNAAFAVLGIEAAYLPFDIEPHRLREFAAVLRSAESVMGINVTVPYKLAIMDHLDDLDPGAARIRAVNTVVRTQEGRLIGYNTDGEGFVDSISKPQPGRTQSFVTALHGADVLLLGAGGSARAVSFHVVQLLDGGKLVICNRTLERARVLADDLGVAGFHALAAVEDELHHWAPRATLIINSTTKGQGGISWLEPYSALAAIPGDKFTGEPTTRSSISKNHQASLELASLIPREVRFYDLIYHPAETVFLRHGRITGHQTMNGKAMIVCQAGLAFFKHICKEELGRRQIDRPETLSRIIETMYKAW